MEKENKMKKEWFETWFDTPYYHILYKNRDFNEAENFISILTNNLNISINSTILDLACGKGRHAYFLAKKGFQVLGTDLSANSIEWAKENYNLPNVEFMVHDMRETIKNKSFNYVFNLFTSFGYFNGLEDNLKVLQAIKSNLKKEGVLVIDFFNAKKVIAELKEKETKHINNIDFNIQKHLSAQKIIKDIRFTDEGKDYHFQEKVQALTLTDFKNLCKASDLEITSVFGNYQLEPYNEKESPRLILFIKQRA